MRGIVPWRRLVRLLLGAGFLCVAWVVLSSMEAQAAASPRPAGLLATPTSSPLLPALDQVTTTTVDAAAKETGTATGTVTTTATGTTTGTTTGPVTAPLGGAVGSAVESTVGTTREVVGQTTRVVEGTTSSVPVVAEVVGEVTPVVRDVVDDVTMPVAATVDAALPPVMSESTEPAPGPVPPSGGGSSTPGSAEPSPAERPTGNAGPAKADLERMTPTEAVTPKVVAPQSIPSSGSVAPRSGDLSMGAPSVPVPSTASAASPWGPDSPGPAVPLGPDPQAPPTPASSSASGPVAGDVAALPLHELLRPAVQSPAGHGPEQLTGSDPGQPDSRPD